jgi:uncharacterized phage infection (PIP) family protein YhgE
MKTIKRIKRIWFVLVALGLYFAASLLFWGENWPEPDED